MTPIIYVDKCESTNIDIEKFISVENFNFLSLYTFHQIKGKGQYGNTWETSDNLNLAFTISVPEHLIKLENTLFNFHTAGLVADFIANLSHFGSTLKTGMMIEIRGLRWRFWS